MLLSMSVNTISYKTCHCYCKYLELDELSILVRTNHFLFQDGRDIIELNWNQVTMITWKNGTNGELVETFKNLSKDAV